MEISIAACRRGEDTPVNGTDEWCVRRDKGGRRRRRG